MTITITDPPPPPHQNPVNNLDVNADGFVSPIDALLIVNFINANGGGTPVSGLPAPPPYRDVDGNNIISASDVATVINYLNMDRGQGEGEGEGESLAGTGQFMAAGTLALPQDWGTQAWIGRSSDNARIGMRLVDRSDADVYGPSLPEQLEDAVFGSDSESAIEALAAAGWQADTDNAQELPVDLALASLFDELDLDEGV